MSGGFWVCLAWLVLLIAWAEGPRVARATAWLLYGLALRARAPRRTR
jgi:hypothetical protein